MANPEMWKVATSTNCGRPQVTCRNARPLEPDDLYDDPDDAAQMAAGEEDQTQPGWEGI